MTAQQSSTRVVYAAIAANGGVAISKFVVAAISGSSAILSEGIHSLVDTANEGLLLLGQRRSEKPSSPEHPFGHGKELYFWSLIVAVLLFGLGGGMAIYEGIVHLLHPKPMGKAVWSYTVLGIAAVLEGGSFAVAYREIGARHDEGQPLKWWRRIRRSKDPSVFSVFAEDIAALLGLVVAAVGVTLSLVFDSPVYDGAASVVIGLILAVVAVALAHESRGLLVGESATPDVVRRIQQAARGPKVVSVGAPQTMHMGPEELLVHLDVQLDPELVVPDAADVLDAIEARIRDEAPEVQAVALHLRRSIDDMSCD